MAVIRRTASKVLLANFASMFSEICATPVQGAYPSDGPIMDVLRSPIMPYLLERHKLRDYDRWRGCSTPTLRAGRMPRDAHMNRQTLSRNQRPVTAR